jgi:tetratricopeptide (TPR) repeat protein
MTPPRSAGEFFGRALQRHRQGDLRGALADFEEAARLDPGSAPLRNNCGAMRQALGDLDGALAAFEEALRCDPRSAEALNNRGVIRLMRGDVCAALADFDAAVALSPAYAHALTNRGAARHRLGDLNGALADFNEALRVSPGHLDAVRNRALARREADDLAGAAADLMQALPRTPRGAAAGLYLDLASIHLLRADWAAAVPLLDQALAIDPNFTEAYLHRGNARYHLNDPRALDDHIRAFRLDPRLWAREVVEIIHWDLTRDPAAALQRCNAHLARSPDDLVSLAWRGLYHRLLNRTGEAGADLGRVAAANPELRAGLPVLLKAVEELQAWLRKEPHTHESSAHWLRRFTARTMAQARARPAGGPPGKGEG